MGAENSKPNSQRTREDNDARVEREVRRALEIQKQMYEQKCEELRQAQRKKDQNTINRKQVPNNNNAVEQKVTITTSLYPSLSNATNNNPSTSLDQRTNHVRIKLYRPALPSAPIEPAAEVVPTTTARFKEQAQPGDNHIKLKGIGYGPTLPSAPIEPAPEIVPTTTARFKEQAQPGDNLINNRLEPQRHFVNPPQAVPSTSSTNAKSVGQNSANAKSVGQNSANDKPVGQNSTKAKPVGQNSTNARPVGQKSTNAQPVGQKTQETRNGARKKESPSFVQCVTCSNELGLQIYQCKNGHSSCWDCRFGGARCGMCTERITDMRNIALETSIADLKLRELDEAGRSRMKEKCPNSADGCRLSMKNNEIEDHLKECPYREMPCPLTAIFGLCSWTGRITQLKAHFSEMHQEHYQADVDKEMYLLNICVNHKIVYLVNIGTFTFVVHIQVNADNRVICMTVQTLGTKVSASKWTYELHVYNKREPRRKYKYVDTCISSSESVYEIFRQQKCAVLNTEYARNFFNNNQLTYKFFIKRESYPVSNQHKRNTWENRSE